MCTCRLGYHLRRRQLRMAKPLQQCVGLELAGKGPICRGLPQTSHTKGGKLRSAGQQCRFDDGVCYTIVGVPEVEGVGLGAGATGRLWVV